jgi:hypothetical protein
MVFIECSAKTKLGIQQAFEGIPTSRFHSDSASRIDPKGDPIIESLTLNVCQILDTPVLWDNAKKKAASPTITAGQTTEQAQGGCGGYYCSI